MEKAFLALTVAIALILPSFAAQDRVVRRPIVTAGGSSLLTSLVGYWKLDEASGTRNDSHGSNHLTDNNTVTQATGKQGNAAQFTRANSESLSITDNAALSTGDIDFTIAAWVYLDSKPGAGMTVASKDASGQREFALDWLNTSDAFRFFITNNAGTFRIIPDSIGAKSASTWYFLVGWHDAAANTVNIQINNGTIYSLATSGTAPTDTTSDFRIGASGVAGFEGYFDGRIDEVGYWKRVLTSDEKTALYNGGSGTTYPF